MKFKVTSSVILCFLLISCHKKRPKITSEKGGIDIITNIYFDASKRLDSVTTYQVSNLNYIGNEIIELVPDLDIPQIIKQVYFIKDTLCFNMGTPKQATKICLDRTNKNKWFSVYQKHNGTIFFKGILPNYKERKNINDTILFQKKYKRFEVNNAQHFTRYYVYPTDTILPYSLNKQIDNDYNGRLERIDAYHKQNDIFISVQLLPRNKLDEQAQDIFDFQKFIRNKHYKKTKHK